MIHVACGKWVRIFAVPERLSCGGYMHDNFYRNARHQTSRWGRVCKGSTKICEVFFFKWEKSRLENTTKRDTAQTGVQYKGQYKWIYEIQ